MKSKKQVIFDNFKNKTYLWSQTYNVDWWIYYKVINGDNIYYRYETLPDRYYRVVWTWQLNRNKAEKPEKLLYYKPSAKILVKAYMKKYNAGKHTAKKRCPFIYFSILEKNGIRDKLHLRHPNLYEQQLIRKAIKKYGL